LGLGNAEALVVTSKEIGLEVNAEKTEYMHVSQFECRTKSDNKSFEMVEQFK
jgi:hypothetical protein